MSGLQPPFRKPLKAICLHHTKWSHLRCIYANNVWFIFTQNKTNIRGAFPICVCWAEHILYKHSKQMLAMCGYPISGPPLCADIPSQESPSLSAHWSLSLWNAINFSLHREIAHSVLPPGLQMKYLNLVFCELGSLSNTLRKCGCHHSFYSGEKIVYLPIQDTLKYITSRIWNV